MRSKWKIWNIYREKVEKENKKMMKNTWIHMKIWKWCVLFRELLPIWLFDTRLPEFSSVADGFSFGHIYRWLCMFKERIRYYYCYYDRCCWCNAPRRVTHACYIHVLYWAFKCQASIWQLWAINSKTFSKRSNSNAGNQLEFPSHQNCIFYRVQLSI